MSKQISIVCKKKSVAAMAATAAAVPTPMCCRLCGPLVPRDQVARKVDSLLSLPPESIHAEAHKQ